VLTQRLGAAYEARTSSTRFDDNPAGPVYDLALAFNGRRYDQTASVTYRLTPWTELYLPLSWRRDRFDAYRDRDGRSLRVGGGVRFNARSVVSGSLELGRMAFRTQSATVPDYTGPYYQAVVGIRLGDTTSVELARQQNFSYSVDLDRVYYLYRWYRISVRKRVSEHLEVAPNFNNFDQQYAGAAGSSSSARIWGSDVSLVGRRSRYTVSVSYTEGGVPGAPGNHYGRWRVGFSIGIPRVTISDRGMFLNGALGLNPITP
jgi:hypothetical protein